jgi:hypothetical protein
MPPPSISDAERAKAIMHNAILNAGIPTPKFTITDVVEFDWPKDSNEYWALYALARSHEMKDPRPQSVRSARVQAAQILAMILPRKMDDEVYSAIVVAMESLGPEKSHYVREAAFALYSSRLEEICALRVTQTKILEGDIAEVEKEIKIQENIRLDIISSHLATEEILLKEMERISVFFAAAP